MVLCQIRDNGVGMDAPTKAKALEPFFTTKSASSGHHGLGLSIVRDILRDHRAKFFLRSNKGKGTLAAFALPLSAGHEGEDVLSIDEEGVV